MTSGGVEFRVDISGAKLSTASPKHSLTGSHIILKELPLEIKDLADEDVILYAKQIGIDPNSEPDLLWIAKKSLAANLPHPWIPIEDPKGRLYYYNSETEESSWEHPCDSFYRSLAEQQRLRGSSATLSMSGLTSLANLQFIDEDMLYRSDHENENDSNRKSGLPAVHQKSKSIVNEKKERNESEEEVESVEFELDVEHAFDEFSDDDHDADEDGLVTIDVTEGGDYDTKQFKEVHLIELNSALHTTRDHNAVENDNMHINDANASKYETLINNQILNQRTDILPNTSTDRQKRELNIKELAVSAGKANNNKVSYNEFLLDAGDDDDPFAELAHNERNANDLFSSANSESNESNVSKQASAAHHTTHTAKPLETVAEASEKDEIGMDSNESESVRHEIQRNRQHLHSDENNDIDDNNDDNIDENNDEEDNDGDNVVDIEAKFEEITAELNDKIIELRNELREEIGKQRKTMRGEMSTQMSELAVKVNLNERDLRDMKADIAAIRHYHNNNSNQNAIASKTDSERISRELMALRSDMTEETSQSIMALRNELTRDTKTRLNTAFGDLENKFMEFKDDNQREMRSIRSDILNVANNNKSIALQSTELRDDLSRVEQSTEKHNKEYGRQLEKITLSLDEEMDKFKSETQRSQSFMNKTEHQIQALQLNGDEIRSLVTKQNERHSGDCREKIDDLNKQVVNLKQQVNEVLNIIDANKAKYERKVINEANRVDDNKEIAHETDLRSELRAHSNANVMPNRIDLMEKNVNRLCDSLHQMIPALKRSVHSVPINRNLIHRQTKSMNKDKIKIWELTDDDYDYREEDDYMSRATSSLSSSLSEMRNAMPKISKRRTLRKRANLKTNNMEISSNARHNCCLHNDCLAHRNYHTISAPLMTNPSRDFKHNQLKDIRASSSSLLNLIRKTSKKLKEEAIELESLGNYHFISGFKSTLNKDFKDSDDVTIKKLQSVRSDVNEKLKKLTNVINQQKFTQI